MKKLALLGKDIKHSRSKEIYENILSSKVEYRFFDYDDENKIPLLEDIFKNIDGLSITSPYKRHFLDSVILNQEIKALNAINCIKKEDNGFKATNTDYLAMKELLPKYLNGYNEVIILGDGAMGFLTKSLCEFLKVSYKIYSRKLNNLSQVASYLADNQPRLVINCCSRDFIFNVKISKKCIFWDLNYNMSAHEAFFSNAQIPYISGLSLLELQAKYALKFWNFDFS